MKSPFLARMTQRCIPSKSSHDFVTLRLVTEFRECYRCCILPSPSFRKWIMTSMRYANSASSGGDGVAILSTRLRLRNAIRQLSMFLALFGIASAQSPVPRKVYVVDKVTQIAKVQDYGTSAKAQEGEHHTAPVVMAEFMKHCPNVAFTENRDDAEFVLKTQQGSSVLSNPRGDILYISPAKTLGNMVKDVCGYISSH